MNEFVTLPAIAVICYLIAATLKAFNIEKLDKFIPVICGFIGGILGIVVFKTIPDYIAAENWIAALAVGIVSGLASVGINQIYKQFSKVDEFEIETDDELPVEDPENEPNPESEA